MPTKRQILQYAGTVALVAGGTAAWTYFGMRGALRRVHEPFRPYPMDPVAPENFQPKLFVPVASGPFGVLDVKQPLKIRATQSAFTLLPGRESPFLLYQTEHAGQAYQNPIFRIESGARFTATLDNLLTEPTIIHWHGLHTPSTMDGHPKYTVPPGGRYEYDFTVRNRGGTYWYHTHAHELTAKQAYNGLASFFLVDDDEQRKLTQALDLKLGVTDLPLVIQDKRFDAQGRLHYKPNANDAMMGWFGDIILVNLTPNAVHQVTPRTYRLRLLNGSNARIYKLAFVNGATLLNFTVIGTDGGLIERPESATQAFLAPGERLDVLFDAGQVPVGSDIFLKSLAFDAMDNEGMGSMMSDMSVARLPMGMAFNILKLSVIAGERVVSTLPTTLSQIRAINGGGVGTGGSAGASTKVSPAITERKIELSMEHMRFVINGRSFKMDDIAFDVKRGAVEIWSIRNPAVGMPHPMHIHGFSFQVVQRLNSPSQVAGLATFGSGRTVSDLGWKDTVLVWPGETVRIAIDFTHDFPGSQIYLLHCHNLEHEDGGMMINFRVQA
jgi:blue copper oxidase